MNKIWQRLHARNRSSNELSINCASHLQAGVKSDSQFPLDDCVQEAPKAFLLFLVESYDPSKISHSSELSSQMGLDQVIVILSKLIQKCNFQVQIHRSQLLDSRLLLVQIKICTIYPCISGGDGEEFYTPILCPCDRGKLLTHSKPPQLKSETSHLESLGENKRAICKTILSS